MRRTFECPECRRAEPVAIAPAAPFATPECCGWKMVEVEKSQTNLQPPEERR